MTERDDVWDVEPKVVKYSFSTGSRDWSQSDDVTSITCMDGKYVEIEYTDGRRVRYLYNRNLSER